MVSLYFRVIVTYFRRQLLRYPIFTSPAHRAWRSYKFAALSFSLFFWVSKIGLPLVSDTTGIALSEPMSQRLLNSISGIICHQNT